MAIVDAVAALSGCPAFSEFKRSRSGGLVLTLIDADMRFLPETLALDQSVPITPCVGQFVPRFIQVDGTAGLPMPPRLQPSGVVDLSLPQGTGKNSLRYK